MFRLFDLWNDIKKADDEAKKEAVATNNTRKTASPNQYNGPSTIKPNSNETTALIQRPGNK